MRRGQQRRTERRREDTVQSWHNADFNPHEKKATEVTSGSRAGQRCKSWAEAGLHWTTSTCPFSAPLRTPGEGGEAHTHTQCCSWLYCGCLRTSLPSSQHNSAPSTQIKCVYYWHTIAHPHMGGWKHQWPRLSPPSLGVHVRVVHNWTGSLFINDHEFESNWPHPTGN